MMWIDHAIRYVGAALLGVSGGAMVAAGIFALLVKVNVITRMVAATKSAAHCMLYEDIVLLGGVFGNIVSVFQPQLPLGMVFLVPFGFFCGVFVGSLAISLAEMLNAFPVFMRRLNIKQGMGYLLVAFAIGKMFGSALQLL